jgi:hypothetical protein
VQFADDSKHRTLQTTGGATVGSAAMGKPSSSSFVASVTVTDTPANTDSSSGSTKSAGQQQQVLMMASQVPSPPSAAEPVETAERCSTARQPLQVLQGAAAATAAAAADDHQMYSEVHDSGGSRVYVSNSHSTSGTVPSRQPPGRSSSFRRAVHHPPGEALPRILSPGTGEPLECDADANARLFALWGVSGSVTEGSLVSQGTWATNGTATSGTDTAGSDCTDDTGGSILDEVETVFNMTGGDCGAASGRGMYLIEWIGFSNGAA